MRMKISITDDGGRMWQGETILTLAEEGGAGAPVGSPATGPTPGSVNVRLAIPTPVSLDYSLNPRAFTKRHGAGMNGARMFTLLVGYLAKGEVGKSVSFTEVTKLWNEMTQVTGIAFNRKYTTMAKTEGWVDSRDRGSYVVTSIWLEIFRPLRLAE